MLTPAGGISFLRMFNFWLIWFGFVQSLNISTNLRRRLLLQCWRSLTKDGRILLLHLHFSMFVFLGLMNICLIYLVCLLIYCWLTSISLANLSYSKIMRRLPRSILCTALLINLWISSYISIYCDLISVLVGTWHCKLWLIDITEHLLKG